MNKPHLTYEQQVLKLRNEKNLIINDKDLCKEMLCKMGYFSLIGGYKKPFRDPMTRKYVGNTTFEDILALYSFDQKLRSLVMEYVCAIERKFSNAMSYGFCEYFGEEQIHYLDPSNYKSKKPKEISKLINILEYNANTNNEHDYINHQRDTYHNVPLWVLLHALTFGQISKMYQYVIPQVKSRVCRQFDNINQRELEQYMKLLVIFRNVCAHNECLFSYKAYSEIPDTLLHSKLEITTTGGHYDNGKVDLFAVFIAVRYLLSKSDFIELKRRFLLLIKEYTKKSNRITEEQLYSYMGFPEKWKSISRYKKI